jgi:hypothetical protein
MSKTPASTALVNISKALLDDANKECDELRIYAKQIASAMADLLAHTGWANMTDDELREEERLGNGMAPIILRARAAILAGKP